MTEYITKKDLLEKVGISYGRLYRWKRLGLIPEEWFIKRAAPTGQETVLPAAKVLERIDKIKEMMKSLSLDEIAARFSFDPHRQALPFEGLYRLEGLDIQYANAVGNYFKKEGYTATELMMILCCAKTADREKYTVRQYVDLLRYRLPLAAKAENTAKRCVIFAAGGDYHIALFDLGAKAVFDNGLRVISDENFEDMWEGLQDVIREIR